MFRETVLLKSLSGMRLHFRPRLRDQLDDGLYGYREGVRRTSELR